MALSKAQIKAIKAKAKKNYTYDPLYFKVDGREHLIFPKKYGKEWWNKATSSDILRVSVR